eukprot:gene17459-22951_t
MKAAAAAAAAAAAPAKPRPLATMLVAKEVQAACISKAQLAAWAELNPKPDSPRALDVDHCWRGAPAPALRCITG